jgi:hypothetical protein
MAITRRDEPYYDGGLWYFPIEEKPPVEREYTTTELMALTRAAKYFQYNASSRTDLPEIVAQRLERLAEIERIFFGNKNPLT